MGRDRRSSPSLNVWTSVYVESIDWVGGREGGDPSVGVCGRSIESLLECLDVRRA